MKKWMRQLTIALLMALVVTMSVGVFAEEIQETSGMSAPEATQTVTNEAQEEKKAEPEKTAAAETSEEPMAEATPEPVAEATSEPVTESTTETVIEATPEPTSEEVTPESTAQVSQEPAMNASQEERVSAAQEQTLVSGQEETEVSSQEPVVEPEAESAVPFTGSARIELVNTEQLYYGDTVILRAVIENANIAYAIRWESNDGSGWAEIKGEDKEEYEFVVTEQNAGLEYRVVLLTEA